MADTIMVIKDSRYEFKIIMKKRLLFNPKIVLIAFRHNSWEEWTQLDKKDSVLGCYTGKEYAEGMYPNELRKKRIFAKYLRPDFSRGGRIAIYYRNINKIGLGAPIEDIIYLTNEQEADEMARKPIVAVGEPEYRF